MSADEFALLQTALLYVFQPALTWWLALVLVSGVVAGLLAFFLDLATPRTSDD
jgi:hypothetical protein